MCGESRTHGSVGEPGTGDRPVLPYLNFTVALHRGAIIMRTLAIVIIFCILLSVGYSQEKSNYDAGIEAYKRGAYSIAIYDFELRAMKENDPIAQFGLGYIYDQFSDSKSKYWYEKAADQGYVPAQNNLALMYVSKALAADVKDDLKGNLERASQWLQQAEKQQNNSILQFNNGLLVVCHN